MHTDASRSLLEITGADRMAFLQGILTQDVTRLADGHAAFSALLSPQGKILHDFFLIPVGEAIWLDVDASHKDMLHKRLTMYKLRAHVAIADMGDARRVAYRTRAEITGIGHITSRSQYLQCTDPRMAELGERLYLTTGAANIKNTVSAEEYHHHRLTLGVPDGARDIAEDTLLDAGYDLLNAASFTKGCYVGQEVTARMHYKNIARRGFYLVRGEAPLPAFNTPLSAGGIALGTLRGSAGALGLAMLKFDETQKALESGTPILVDKSPVQIASPAWMHTKLAQFRAARENQ